MHNTRSPFDYLDDTTQRSMLPETSKDAKDSPNSPIYFPNGGRRPRPCSESSVMPLHDAGDVPKAQVASVKLIKAGCHATKDLHALEKVVN
ncbi:MAG: hypothetical protein ACI9I0_001777 [Rhodoferax sp.]|jgi:hypothetical protein